MSTSKYSKSLINCSQGSDASCVETGFETACCMYWEVTKAPANPTAHEAFYISAFKLAGFPTAVGEFAYKCADPDTVATISTVAGWWNDWTYDTSTLTAGTGDVYKAYCAGATSLQAAGIAMASLVWMGSY